MTLMNAGLLKRIGLASAMVVGLSGAALAADPVEEKAGHDWDIAFGVTATSDYISRGFTQTDGGAAIQPWAELTVGMFYAGYWGSNVAGGWEHDLSVGIRPELGPVSLDLGYVRYIYSTGDCCGEVYAKASISPAEPLTLGAAVFHDPDAKNTYFEGNASFALVENISASGALGLTNWGDGSPDTTSWNAGLSWTPAEWVKFDGRYYGGPTADKVVFSVSLMSSVKTFMAPGN